MTLKEKNIPVKYKNLLNRVGVDTDNLRYKYTGQKYLTESIFNGSFFLIINRKNDTQISVTIFDNVLKDVLFNEVYDFTDKTYLKTIQEQSQKYFK